MCFKESMLTNVIVLRFNISNWEVNNGTIAAAFKECEKYTDIFNTNLLQRFTLVALAATCFGFESRPSSRICEPFRRIQHICQLIYM